MKPVGKLDAGNPHVQFDERGWETGRNANRLSYRAHPRLYLSNSMRQVGAAVISVVSVNATPVTDHLSN